MKLVLLFFSLFLSTHLFAQTIITGKVNDENGKPLSGINLLVYPHDKEALIAFGVSDKNGQFSIKMKHVTDSLRVEASSMHYRKDSLFIENKSCELIFDLVPEVKDLNEFVVKASPVIKKGDTISYLVSSFSDNADRSIADVIKKMPGIEVESSGRILYQGSPIQHLYVENLDLMGGRYGLVSNNLPHNSVSTIEVLENHQPIKILEDRIPSYRASLNVKLKNQIATTGTAELGSGYKPILWDANITPMMFTKKFQLAGSYQANNSGDDVSKQLRVLTSENFMDKISEGQSSGLLSIPELSPPNFNEKRYLENNIHLLNANSLIKLDNDLQLRSNLYYIYDTQKQQGNTRRIMYTPSDTLVFNETVRNDINNNYLQGEFTLNRNTKDNYLRNKLLVKSNWDKRYGTMSLPEEHLRQKLDNPFMSFSNDLSVIKPIKEKLIRFSSKFLYGQNPQTLFVSPGQFEDTFNNGFQYEEIYQDVNLQRFNTHHSVSFSSKWKSWNINPKIGFQHNQQWLNSETSITAGNTGFISENISQNSDGKTQIQGEDAQLYSEPIFTNNFEGINTKTYIDTEFNYKKNSFTFSTDLPISHIYYNMQDIKLNKGETISKFIFDPGFSLDYKITGFWRTRASYSYKNSFGNMEDIHYAYVLTNYRSLQRNDAMLSKSQRHNITAFLSYRNPIESFFSSLTYFYIISNNSMLYSNSIHDDGSSVMVSKEIPNTSYMHNGRASISKFFPGIKGTLALDVNYSRTDRKQLLNDSILNATNNIYAINPRLNIKFAQWLNTEYKASMMFYNTYHEDIKLNEISTLRHFLNILIFPKNNQFVSINGEYYMHEDKNNLFVDLQYRYTITSRKIDIDFRWINIFNNSTYRDFYLDTYSLVENHYILRPSQFVLSVKFNF
ncbi:MAG: hypothetical protein ACOCWC_05070 [Bacteroidota bacterium]